MATKKSSETKKVVLRLVDKPAPRVRKQVTSPLLRPWSPLIDVNLLRTAMEEAMRDVLHDMKFTEAQARKQMRSFKKDGTLQKAVEKVLSGWSQKETA